MGITLGLTPLEHHRSNDMSTNSTATETTTATKTNQERGSGYLEISDKGFGFLRSAENHFQPKPTDIFVTPDTIKKNFLREGCLVYGPTQPPHRGSSPQLREVEKVNNMPFSDYTKAMRFENLTTIDPLEKFSLETTPDLIETRIIDLVTPIGKGTRGLIVAPPRTGKTTILKQIANSVTANHPEVHVLVLLIDERPEEVTDFQRSVKAEVVASSNDMDLETHVRLSRFMIERCRRMVEAGKDVFVLLDSITRVARAYNSVHGGSGRTMTGGVDARALEIPRKMFAAARYGKGGEDYWNCPLTQEDYERFYAALKGNGANVRYVVLPLEAHGYRARESVGHTLWEMTRWLDQYVNNAGPRAAN